MKLAMVVNTLSNGGAERVLCNLTRWLPEAVEIDLIVNDDTHIDYPYRGRILSLNIPSDVDRMTMRYQLRSIFTRTRKLRALKKEHRYDAVISFSENANLANILSGGHRILSVHHTYSSNSKKKIYRMLEKLITHSFYNHADAVIGVSKEICEELATLGGVKRSLLHTIYNGVDPAAPHICPEAEPLKDRASSEPLRLINVGRLTPVKGQIHLLRAVSFVKSQGFSFSLQILGEGPVHKDLEQAIKDLGLEQEVALSGFVSDIYEQMSHSDLLICTSRMEGYSIALLEAQTMGVPVISTDHMTGAREILAPDTDFHQKVTDRIDYAEYGVLVPVCSRKDETVDAPLTPEESLLADAIITMIQDPELRTHYRQKGLQRKEILMPAIAEQWMSLIRELYET